jgi:hypothetical protein
MFDDKHLHIDQSDRLSDWLSKVLRSVKGGTFTIEFAEEPAAKIAIDDGNIVVDLLEPKIFRLPGDETRLFDKLKTATEFGRKLADNSVTLSFLRKGKEAIILGKDARPTLSKILTRSDDIQMSSLGEFTKLKGDFKTN